MKNFKRLIILCAVFFAAKIAAQVSFTISPSFCVNDITTVSSSVNNAMSYTWVALPSGPVFSAPTSSTTIISFPSAGVYTIGLGILTVSGPSYAAQTVTVVAYPVLTVTGASFVCNGSSVALVGGGANAYTWSPAASLNTSTGFSVIASPLGATTYSIVGANGSCTASTTHSVGIAPLPNVQIVASQYSVCAGYTTVLNAYGAINYSWTGTSLSASLASQYISCGPGTYTVIGSDSKNCINSDAITIGLNPDLVITVTQSSPTTCITSNFPHFSKPVVLNASGAGTYVWFPYDLATTTYSIGPTTTVRPGATTCYTVVGSTPVCSGSAVVCVTVIPQFTVAISPALPPVICQGDVISLSVANISTQLSSPPYTYFWHEPLNAPPISMSSYYLPVVSVFPQNTCTYTMEVKDAHECISFPALATVSVTVCNDLSEVKEKSEFIQIYPNPANNLLYIHSEESGPITIEVLDALGKMVLKKSLEGNSVHAIELPIPAGIYFVKMNSGSKYSETRKLVKE